MKNLGLKVSKSTFSSVKDPDPGKIPDPDPWCSKIPDLSGSATLSLTKHIPSIPKHKSQTNLRGIVNKF